MAKKKNKETTKAPDNKAAVKAAKKAKAAAKVEKKETKAQKKSKKLDDDDEVDDNDLEGILDRMRIEWEEKHRVTEETVEGPPSRRANATLTPDPSGNHLWCIGGEFFSEDGKAHFYNDVYRYTPEKNEWRRYTSATCPGPRSAHAAVATPAAGGKIFLFGGEFSSLHQTTFHHYRDLWEFDIASRSWERIDTKAKPTSRSGHRMALWKHLIVLFGGFYDPGIRTQYLNDLWIFDTQEYTWKQVEMREMDRKPSPRSGFSFIPNADGIVLHGGYCKEYVKGKPAKGIALEDTWFLKMSTEPKELKWERRKKSGYAPSVRSGCTMTLWPTKEMGILFGGVKDDDQSEETLVSEFFNDLYGYHTAGNGRWASMMLKKPKKKPGGGGKKQKAAVTQPKQQRDDHSGSESEDEDDGEETAESRKSVIVAIETEENEGPILPLPRYNAMLAVLRSTLYIYGGILERGSREITLDDFWSLALDKMDAYTCLKPLTVDVTTEDDESSSDEDGDDDEEGEDTESEGEGEGPSAEVHEDSAAVIHSDDDEPQENVSTFFPRTFTHLNLKPTLKRELRTRATEFLEASNKITAEEAAGTPLPGETLAKFYERTREHWVQQAFAANSNNRGKELRKEGFELANDRYEVYKPVLKEVEKILEEAGLDVEEMKKVAGGTGSAAAGASRNRR